MLIHLNQTITLYALNLYSDYVNYFLMKQKKKPFPSCMKPSMILIELLYILGSILYLKLYSNYITWKLLWDSYTDNMQ